MGQGRSHVKCMRNAWKVILQVGLRLCTDLSCHAGREDEHVCIVFWLIWLHAMLCQVQVGIECLHIGSSCIVVPPYPAHRISDLAELSDIGQMRIKALPVVR